MGEILSTDTVDLLRNSGVRKAIRTLVETDQATPQSVEIKSPQGETATVTLRIASS